MSSLATAIVTSGRRLRPLPIPHDPIAPPFDPDDPPNVTPTTLPPEQVIPRGYDIRWWRGDIGGTTVPDSQPLPLVPGGNALTQWTISFLLPWYTRAQQDIILTQHARRNFSHIHLDWYQAQAAGYSMTQFAQLIAYCQSWGFFTSAWMLSKLFGLYYSWADAAPIIDPLLAAITAQADITKHVAVVGAELNACTQPGSPGLDDMIRETAKRSPYPAVHFEPNYPGWPPPNVPPEVWYADLGDALKLILWQGDSSQAAATQAAHCWDTRWRAAVGNPDLRVVAFELRASEQLYGRVTENQAALTGWENLCATRNALAPNALAVAGFGNNARYPNGTPI